MNVPQSVIKSARSRQTFANALPIPLNFIIYAIYVKCFLLGIEHGLLQQVMRGCSKFRSLAYYDDEGKTKRRADIAMMDYRNYNGGRNQTCSGRGVCRVGETAHINAERGMNVQNGCAVMEQVPVMVYIVEQKWGNVYTPCRALMQGTLFPALDKPFFGKGGCGCD